MSFENIGAIWRNQFKKGKSIGKTYFKGHIIVDGEKHGIVLMPFIRSQKNYDKDPKSDPAYTISLIKKDDQTQNKEKLKNEGFKD